MPQPVPCGEAVTRDLTITLAWARDGAAQLRALMLRMGDDAFAAPSGVPGWTRAALLTHLARNADALINLLTWARTGERTPAYVSDDAREADIAEGALRSPAEVRADVIDSSDRLADAVREMPEKAWSRTVDMRGREIEAREIAWLRAVETWVHAIDLDVGAEFADFPAPLLHELIGRTVAQLAPTDSFADVPDVVLVDRDEPERRWRLHPASEGEPVAIVASAPEIASWLLGRSSGRRLRTASGRPLPTLPPWR
jgi:maleylpyruvate isomerase